MLRWTSRCLVWLGGTASTNALGVEVRPGAGMFVNVLPEGVQKNRRTAAHFNPTANPADVLLNNNFAAPELRHSIGRMPQHKPQMQRWMRGLRADVYDELLKLPLRYALHSFDRLHAHLYAHAPSAENVEVASATLPRGVYRHDVDATKGAAHHGTNAAEPHIVVGHSDGPQSRPDALSPAAPMQATRFDSAVQTLEQAETSSDDVLYAVAGRNSSVGYAPPLGPADPLDTIGFFVHRNSNGHLPGKLHSMNTKILMPAFYMRIQNVDGDMFRFEEELLKIFPTQKIFVRSHSVYVYNVNRDARMILHHWLLGLGF